MDTTEFDDLMEKRVLPELNSLINLNEYTFQFGNASIHANSIEKLANAGHTILPWTAKSFDMSPKENLWGLGKRKKNQTLSNKSIRI